MPDIIVIGGAPGSGKTTLGKLLQARLDSLYIDFGWLRQFHLDDAWSNASPREEAMSFENLAYIVRNYLRHGYRNVILADFEDWRLQEIPIHFRYEDFVIATLVLHDDAEHAPASSTRPGTAVTVT
ncbi:MAG: AAA family ATPase [Caldilineaceae bacterium]